MAFQNQPHGRNEQDYAEYESQSGVGISNGLCVPNDHGDGKNAASKNDKEHNTKYSESDFMRSVDFDVAKYNQRG